MKVTDFLSHCWKDCSVRWRHDSIISQAMSFKRCSRCWRNSASGQCRSRIKDWRASSFQNRSSEVAQPFLCSFNAVCVKIEIGCRERKIRVRCVGFSWSEKVFQVQKDFGLVYDSWIICMQIQSKLNQMSKPKIILKQSGNWIQVGKGRRYKLVNKFSWKSVFEKRHSDIINIENGILIISYGGFPIFVTHQGAALKHVHTNFRRDWGQIQGQFIHWEFT